MKRLCVSAALLCLMIGACKKTTPYTGSNTTSPNLQVVFQDSTYQLTGVAISHEGRLFTSYPLWSTTYKNAVAEITHGNPETPFPDVTMNSWMEGDSGMNKWVCAQAVYVDANNNLWVVDPASPGTKRALLRNNSQKLVEINLGSNTVTRTYPLNGATDDQSYINDVRIDAKTIMSPGLSTQRRRHRRRGSQYRLCPPGAPGQQFRHCRPDLYPDHRRPADQQGRIPFLRQFGWARADSRQFLFIL